MVAFARLTSRQSAPNPLVAPVGGATAGLGIAMLFAVMPVATLEDWIWTSGVQALVAAAAPPLGTTARAVLAIAGGGMAAAVAWSMLYLLFGEGGLLASARRGVAIPVMRRGDAHPDTPPRRPMTAAEMGTPLMEVATPAHPPAVRPLPVAPSVRSLPVDLEQPLAAFDPSAIPDVPLTPTAPVAPLARKVEPPQPLAPGERINTFVLTPPPAKAAVEPRRGTAQPSIDALLRRLEDVAAQRIGVPAR